MAYGLKRNGRLKKGCKYRKGGKVVCSAKAKKTKRRKRR